MEPGRLVPTTVLTGFLGAGKTTLLREILGDPGGLKIGVLVNDFGEINIDAALIVEGTAESISLSNGCVCCTIQDELVTAVRGLVEARPDLDRIVIEASGVSRSLPIADTMISGELRDIVSLDGMFCLVDAASFPEQDFATTELAIDQITGADLLILNKIDLVTPSEQERLRQQLQGLMPTLRTLATEQGKVPLDILFGPVRAQRLESLQAIAHTHFHSTGHAAGHDHHVHGPECGCGADHKASTHVEMFQSWSWQCAEPVDEARLRTALRKLGAGLLRAKGILNVRRADGSEGSYEFQQVGKRSTLKPLPQAGTRGSVLVAIGLHAQVDGPAFEAALDACRLQGANA